MIRQPTPTPPNPGRGSLVLYLFFSFYFSVTPALLVGGLVSFWWPTLGWTLFAFITLFMLAQFLIRRSKRNT